MKSQSLTSSLLVVAISFLFVAGTIPATFGAAASPVLTKVSVTLTFTPKSQKVSPGGTATNTVAIKNSGTKTVVFTGCIAEVKLSTQKSYSMISCSVPTPITVAGGKTLKEGWETSFTTAAMAGTYNFKIALTTATQESGFGTFNVVVT